MKKTITPFFILFILSLTSCSHIFYSARFPATMSIKGDCVDVLDELVRPMPTLWNELSENRVLISQYQREFRSITLSDPEIEWIRGMIKELPPEEIFRKKLRSGVLYARTLSTNQAPHFEKEFARWIKEDDGLPSLAMRKFLRHYRRVEKFEDKMYHMEFNKLGRLDSTSRQLRSRVVAHEKARLYERNYYRCMNAVADPTQVTKEGLKRANTVALGITFGGGASALITYGATNYDREMDFDWWAEIGFVVVTSMAMGYINSKWVIANPRLKMWSQRFPLLMAATAVEDIGVTALWTYLLGAEPRDHEEVKRLLADPKFQERLHLFKDWLENTVDFEKHLEQFSQIFELYAVHEDGEIDENAPTGESILTFDPEDLDEEQTIALLIQALSDYEYHQNKGPLSLGSEDYDRYAFHRGIDLIYQSSFLIAGDLMYKTLCSTPNPKLAIMKSIGVFMAINLATDGLYFFSRRELINQ
jgi:uncharacterized protein YozE (UPF0346 family)